MAISIHRKHNYLRIHAGINFRKPSKSIINREGTTKAHNDVGPMCFREFCQAVRKGFIWLENGQFLNFICFIRHVHF